VKGDPKNRGFATRAIHAGQPPDPVTGAVAVPIYQNVTYVHDELGRHKGYEYARVQNPTREALEANVASIESGQAGHAFASGMAAISTLASLLEAGDHAVVSGNVYGGTYRLFREVLERYQLTFSWVDSSNLDELAAAMTPSTRLVLIETPTNPLMEITDLAGAAEIARAGEALLAVDNTFMSPYFQRPLELGADIVMHSATKFLGGHSDSLGGVLVTNDERSAEWFAFMQKSAGAVLAPIESFLMLRGIKTLAVRMQAHETRGRAIARLLADHPKVQRVLYPGLPDHPGHELHRSQASGFGAMITFDVGGFAAAKRVLDRVEVMALAESLGGVESLVSHPASMTHASVPPDQRAKIGLTDGMVRISVGLEDLEDLTADLEQALDEV
jgi:cystathionine beta-lyase/cystathionine gamma-synthase